LMCSLVIGRQWPALCLDCTSSFFFEVDDVSFDLSLYPFF